MLGPPRGKSPEGSSNALELEALKLCINRIKEISAQVIGLERRMLDSNQLLVFERRLSDKIEERLAQFMAELTASIDVWFDQKGKSAPHDGNNVHDTSPGELQVIDGPERKVDVVSLQGINVDSVSCENHLGSPNWKVDAVSTQGIVDSVSCENIPDGPEQEADMVSPERQMTFEDIMCKKEKATLEASVWNLSFFLGHPTVGKCGSVHIFILLAFNIFTQGVFLFVLATILTEETYTDETITYYRKWRQNIGQNVKYYDKLSFTSLAERVCGSDPVEMSDGTKSDLQAMERYNPKDHQSFFDFIGSGPSLHTVSLMCWSIAVLREFSNILRELTALSGLRILKSTNISIEQDNYVLKSVSHGRLIGYIIVLSIRTFICICLWHRGTLFLIHYTIDPADLILNSVALEVILHVDQTFYVLAPFRAQHVLENMKPLICRGTRCKRCSTSLDLRSVCLTIIFMLFILGCLVLEINPLVENIRKATKAICGGNKDFVFTVDPMSFVYSSPTNPEGVIYEDTLKFPHIKAIQELIHGDIKVIKGTKVPLSMETRDVDVVIQRSTLTMSEAVEALSEGCNSDPLAHHRPTLQRFMFELFIVVFGEWKKKVLTCNDIWLIGGCNSPIAAFRAVCPYTCGCDLPDGPGLRHPVDGCPAACMNTKRGLSAILDAPCEELSPAELRLNSMWELWAREFGWKIENAMGEANLERRLLLCASGGGNCTETFIVHGCGAIPLLSDAVYKMFGDSGDMCRTGELSVHVGLIFVPLATRCPATCDCIGKTDEDRWDLASRYCPGTCEM